MTDVLLQNGDDGGEIEAIGGVLTMSDGLYAFVYLCLFGGNNDDDGSTADAARQWWGNRIETEPARVLRGQLQKLLQTIPVTSASLAVIEAAAEADLSPLVDELGAQVSALASIPAANAIRLEINVVIDGQIHTFTFTESWGVSQ